MRYLVVGPRGEVPVRSGELVLVQYWPGEKIAAAGLWAVRGTEEDVAKLGHPTMPRDVGDRRVDAAVALLRNRDRVRFDPADGSPLIYDESGIARSPSGGQVFPRVDPAVIGIVELRGEDRLLLGRNAERSWFYSLIAGYVSHGETLEDAFAREVMEEAARRVTDISYVASQPWPVSGSIMIGMQGITEDEDMVGETDGELAESIWVSPRDIIEARIPVAPSGSIAHDLIKEWAQRKDSRR